MNVNEMLKQVALLKVEFETAEKHSEQQAVKDRLVNLVFYKMPVLEAVAPFKQDVLDQIGGGLNQFVTMNLARSFAKSWLRKNTGMTEAQIEVYVEAAEAWLKEERERYVNSDS